MLSASTITWCFTRSIPAPWLTIAKPFSPALAKSDPVDARILVELLQKHSDKIPAWQPESPDIRALRQWVESRRMLVQEKVRLTNRITAALKNYYPQVLDWFEDKDKGHPVVP
jgi:transposase